ncbi:hypothetical protein Q9966_013001 [Columba livia]|nr:hypothetical protein Q9966_013001 [Columba livia]
MDRSELPVPLRVCDTNKELAGLLGPWSTEEKNPLLGLEWILLTNPNQTHHSEAGSHCQVAVKGLSRYLTLSGSYVGGIVIPISLHLFEQILLKHDDLASALAWIPQQGLLAQCKLGYVKAVEQHWIMGGGSISVLMTWITGGTCIAVQDIGTHTIGTHTIGTHTIGTHSISTHTIGTHTIGTHSIGTHSIGTHTIGTHSIGTQTGAVTAAAAPSQDLQPRFLPSGTKAVKKVRVLQMNFLLIPEIKGNRVDTYRELEHALQGEDGCLPGGVVNRLIAEASGDLRAAQSHLKVVGKVPDEAVLVTLGKMAGSYVLERWSKGITTYLCSQKRHPFPQSRAAQLCGDLYPLFHHAVVNWLGCKEEQVPDVTEEPGPAHKAKPSRPMTLQAPVARKKLPQVVAAVQLVCNDPSAQAAGGLFAWEPQEDRALQSLCVDILGSLDVTRRGMSQLLWPRLLQYVVPAQYSGVLIPLSRGLRALLERRERAA